MGHNILLIDKVKDKENRKKYIEGTLANGWSRSVLTMQIESDYHLRIGTSSNNFNALLLLRCYVVVELKTNKFKPEYTGQLGFYVTAIDEILKKEADNHTIGLLLCKDKDRLSVDWALKSTNVPIGVSSFEIKNVLPKEIIDKLPSEDDLNLHIDISE